MNLLESRRIIDRIAGKPVREANDLYDISPSFLGNYLEAANKVKKLLKLPIFTSDNIEQEFIEPGLKAVAEVISSAPESHGHSAEFLMKLAKEGEFYLHQYEEGELTPYDIQRLKSYIENLYTNLYDTIGNLTYKKLNHIGVKESIEDYKNSQVLELVLSYLEDGSNQSLRNASLLTQFAIHDGVQSEAIKKVKNLIIRSRATTSFNERNENIQKAIRIIKDDLSLLESLEHVNFEEVGRTDAKIVVETLQYIKDHYLEMMPKLDENEEASTFRRKLREIEAFGDKILYDITALEYPGDNKALVYWNSNQESSLDIRRRLHNFRRIVHDSLLDSLKYDKVIASDIPAIETSLEELKKAVDEAIQDFHHLENNGKADYEEIGEDPIELIRRLENAKDE